jgi:hypothetical protein
VLIHAGRDDRGGRLTAFDAALDPFPSSTTRVRLQTDVSVVAATRQRLAAGTPRLSP